ncbi:hypothetical protein A1359_13195 [Methylomonas lenta]|uniref:NACHT domain-containing protein n=1 Tax=Methylomonas lenta TaxID=980561 RepID=A0A177N439_9GAMM|nr:HEAT repeat domain-containing protein [Methylomonas lenta]OAI12642.1 hypothetical protein A1359_13195 [Methylomonas lenta]
MNGDWIRDVTSIADLTNTERCYRNALIGWFKWLPLPNVFGGKIDLSKLDLAHLFVRLKLRPLPTAQIPDPPSELHVNLTSDQLALLPDLAAGLASFSDLGDIRPEVAALVKRWLSELRDPPVVDFSEILNKSKYVVITGGGGTGKTTLTRWLTLVCSQNSQAKTGNLGPEFTSRLLPIWVDLKGFGAWITKPDAGLQDRTIEQIIVAYVTRPEAPGTGIEAAPILLNAFQSGEAIVLFDGLDEIFEQACRNAVINMIRKLAVGDSAKGSRVVVTSRPYACPLGTLGPAFAYTDIELFDLSDLYSYLVDHWYPTAYGQTYTMEAQQLVIQIKANPHLRELAVNPLLCTLLAVLYRSGLRPLPIRRTEIYERCTDLLLNVWDEGKGVSWPSECSKETKLALCAALAYETFKTAPSLILQKMVARELVTIFLQNQLGCTPDEAGRSAESLLQTIENRAGIIESRDDGSLQFLLRPFLDYLTARHLAVMSAEDVVDEIMPHVFDGDWSSVILLTVARFPELKDGQERLNTLLRAMDRAMPPPPRLPNWVFARLRVWRDAWLESQLLRIDLMLAEAFFESQGHIDQPLRSDVLLPLENRLCVAFAHGLMERRELAANALANIMSLSEPAGNMLVAALQSQDQSIRYVTASVLARRVSIEPTARDELLKASLSDDPDVASSVITHLWPIITDNYPELDHAHKRKIVRNYLGSNPRFEDDVMGMFVETATHANEILEDIAYFKGLGDPRSTHRDNLLRIYMDWLGRREIQCTDVVEALTTSLPDLDLQIRQAAAMGLSRSKICVPGVIDALRKALEDENHSVRFWAAFALSARAPIEPNAMTALMDAFKDGESNKRLEIIPAFSELAAVMPGALDVLRDGLADQSFAFRFSVAEHLRSNSVYADKCLSVFREALHDPSPALRRSGVERVAELAQLDDAAFHDLRSAVDDPDNGVRLEAIKGLIRFPQYHEEGVAALKRMLTDHDPKTRFSVIKKLFALPDGLTTDEIASILTEDEGLWDNESSSWGLVEMSKYVSLVSQRIEKRLRHGKNRQRYNLLHALAEEGKSDPLLVDPYSDVLSDLLQDGDRDIPFMAARALKRVRHPTPRLIRIICNELGHFSLWPLFQPSRSNNTKAEEALIVAVQRVDLSDPGMSEAIDALFNLLRKGKSCIAVVKCVHTLIARGHEPALAFIPDVVGFATRGEQGIRKAALPILALDPKAQYLSIYDQYLDILAAGMRSSSHQVRVSAFTTLRQLTHGRALPSFNWVERNYSKARYKWLIRITGIGIAVLALIYSMSRFANDPVINGVATILAAFLALLGMVVSQEKISQFLKPPQRLRRVASNKAKRP